ncbi:Uncharacterised protein [Mycobacteroides abscessus subsp. massiliense]|nr:Uncharacterised protein [Mycobacteroides abscessus subsp. massiliense]
MAVVADYRHAVITDLDRLSAKPMINSRSARADNLEATAPVTAKGGDHLPHSVVIARQQHRSPARRAPDTPQPIPGYEYAQQSKRYLDRQMPDIDQFDT